ncbi:hypothetical protein GGQ74_000602 [Desulfobaculum xiamenense]|uniref:Lysylphosphatidylglycerol synthase TM region n=1 Tax=Desulfobaculum xiamenense TaxID=995050 RepID=A0A846QKH9_9BACT|nr:lysylphosphatidylglycerol synthase transmembrane domain-containing protein [Desulfobaculum xiamenense]NJB66962.1 hypothetical protein [Desulfobaculum xiamenense]
MKRWLGRALRLGLTAGCIAYVVRGTDFAALGEAMLRMAPAAVAAALCAACVDYMGMGARLMLVSGRRVGWLDAINASVLCNGLNVVLPARMGEVAKVVHLRRRCGIPAGAGMGMVFWERFADLNMLLFVALAAAGASGQTLALAPVAIAAGGVWGALIVMRLFPAMQAVLLRLLIFERLRLFAAEVLGQLRERMTPGFLAVLALASLWPWTMHWVQHWLLLVWGAGLDLTPVQVLAIFVMSAGGLAVPSSPGNIGVYEAVMVAGLGLYGVPREEALAIALVCHMTFQGPLALYALGLMAFSGMEARELRDSAGAGPQTPNLPHALADRGKN